MQVITGTFIFLAVFDKNRPLAASGSIFRQNFVQQPCSARQNTPGTPAASLHKLTTTNCSVILRKFKKGLPLLIGVFSQVLAKGNSRVLTALSNAKKIRSGEPHVCLHIAVTADGRRRPCRSVLVSELLPLLRGPPPPARRASRAGRVVVARFAGQNEGKHTFCSLYS